MINYFPKYFTRKAVGVYILLLFVTFIAFYNHILPFWWIATGLISVVVFFSLSNTLTKKWASLSNHVYERKIFWTALIVRSLYVITSYKLYENAYGQPFEFKSADAISYHLEAIWLLSLIEADKFSVYLAYFKGEYSDLGYVAYLTTLYYVFGNSILIARLLKAVISAYTCILIFRLTERNFGVKAARIAGILSLLSPTLIYYCGLHLKETEMVFLTVLFLERADKLIRLNSIKIPLLLVSISLALSLFFFRTILGAAALTSLIVSYMLYPEKKLNFGKKLFFGLSVVMLVFLMRGGGLNNEVSQYWSDRGSNQQASMQARAKIKAGNKLATYGQTAIFAPFIIIAPFPTLINIEEQQNQMLLNGGYFVKNILGFFVFAALFYLTKLKKIRSNLLIVSLLLSYLAVLALSKFAISERFHMPVYPVIIILTSYGITKMNQVNKKYYTHYLILISVIIIGWSWFKLAGRA